MSRISTLSKAQWDEVAEFRESMLRLGRSVETVDRERTTTSIKALYREISAKEPRVIYLDSPLAAILAIPLVKAATSGSFAKIELPDQLTSQLDLQLDLQLYSQLTSQLRSQLRSQLDSQLYSQLTSQLDLQLDSQLDLQLYSQLTSQLRSQLDSQLYSQLDSQLRSQLDSQLRSQLDSQLDLQLRSQLYSQLDSQLRSFLGDRNFWRWPGNWSWWWCWYNFMPRIGVKYDDTQSRLLGYWMGICESAHWWWSLDQFAFVSDRPSRIKVDERGRLHSLDGPALGYRDGYSLFSVHGVRVDRRIIEKPETINANEIKTERNAEVRRVMLSRFGEARYLQETGAKLVHTDARGELYRTDLGDDEPLTMVKVMNSTPEPDGSIKPYWLRVPPDMRTATQAVAWTFGLTAKEYAPRHET